VDSAVAAALREFYSYVDSRAARLERRDPRFVCPTPCSGCCVANVFFVTALDFMYLCRFVRETLRPDQIASVVSRAREQVAVCGIEEAMRLDSGDSGQDQHPVLRQPCPLLEDGRCVAYAARPTPCRFFGRSRFESGEMNLCEIIERRLGDDAASAGLPIVESYSRHLARVLARHLGPGGLVDVEPLVGVSTLPVFIAGTEFGEEAVLSVSTGAALRE
jgi:Fe-S-cluster containining protein